MSGQLMALAPDVTDAIARDAPVVALESTILTHGMPHPQNIGMALRVEAIIREEGAVPATVAVIDGTLRIGLDGGQLDSLARTTDALKLSRADLAFAVATGRTGATTVAATMIAARRAGIGVFATGGIGGVHRGASRSFDISADLDELARTGTIVVCAGPKAILDLEKTLEVLETKGVPVIGYGTDRLPAFWSRDSGLPVSLRLDSPQGIAAFQAVRHELGIEGGMLVANPVPEAAALPRETVEAWIEQALSDAATAGIAGKAVTPFVLRRMFELSDGQTLVTNIALVENNARLAARIAVALSRHRRASLG